MHIIYQMNNIIHIKTLNITSKDLNTDGTDESGIRIQQWTIRNVSRPI